MKTTKHKNLITDEVYEVGMRKGSYRIVNINTMNDGNIRSIEFEKLTLKGKKDNRTKNIFKFNWQLGEINESK